MESTSNLSLPYIMPSQAQKHITHNEALRMLDAVVQLSVIDRDLVDPPSSPAEGDRYIVPSAASGPWEGATGHIAAWQDGAWSVFDPKPGWMAWVADEKTLVFWDGISWASVSETITTLQNLARLGVGTTADIETPFAAKLNKVLWAARSAEEGGSGDLRYTLNKQSPANVLSLLMQSGWSGRAEIGLVGDDDLAFKVSPDGSQWVEALKIDRQTGKASFPSSNLLADYAVSLYPDSGRFGGNDAKSIAVGAFSWPPYFTLYNGATVEGAGKFITNNDDYGGSGGMLPADVKDLIDMIREPSSRRYGVEFNVARITMGAGRSSSSISVGDGRNYFLSAFIGTIPRLPRMTFHVYLRALDTAIAWRCYPGQTILKDGVAFTSHMPITPSEGWVSVTVMDEQNPRTNAGYQPWPFNIACADTGDRWLLACPALMGGITGIDDNVGVIAGINQFLP